MPPIGYPGNSISKKARAKAGGGYESAIENSAPAAQRVISGTGFGSGPNVGLFHRGKDDPESVVALSDPEIGAWSEFVTTNGGVAKYFTANGRGWIKGRDNVSSATLDITGLRALLEQDYAEFTIAYRNLIPTGYKFPGASAPGVKDNENSSWKPCWPSTRIGPEFEGSNGGADLVLGTHVGNNIILDGNSVQPKRANGNTIYWNKPFRLDSERLTVYYQSGDESSDGANDGIMEWILQDNQGADRVVQLGDPFNPKSDPILSKGYGALQINTWMGNFSPNTADGVLPLTSDCYWAVGPNSRAMIITGNAATLAACTQAHIIPPDRDAQGNPLWTDSEIRFSPTPYEALTYTHIRLGDGTLIENAEGV